MGTIFADDAGAESAGDQRAGEAQSVFRDREPTTDGDDEPLNDTDATDGADSTSGNASTGSDDASTGSDDLETTTMVVFSDGERHEFEVDER